MKRQKKNTTEVPIAKLLKERREIVVVNDRYDALRNQAVTDQFSDFLPDGPYSTMSMLSVHGAVGVRKSANTAALLRHGFSQGAMDEFDARVRAEKAKADLAGAVLDPPGAPVSKAISNPASTATRRSKSHFTKAVTSALIRAPGADGLKISMSIDEDGVEATSSMRGRSYEETYRTDEKARRQLNSRYSKIRRNLRTQRLLD